LTISKKWANDLSLHRGHLPLLEKAYWDSSNVTMKSYTTTSRETAHAVRAMTRKVNQSKYHEVDHLILIINQFVIK